MPLRIDRAEFDNLVKQAIARLPEQFAVALETMPIDVRDRPSPEMLASLGMEEDELLLGLYHGIPLTERSVELSGNLPDVIYLFQDDLQEVSDSREDLIREVETTLRHELGHYFGLDEDDLNQLGYQ